MDGWTPMDILQPQSRQRFSNRLERRRVVLVPILRSARSRSAVCASSPSQTEIALSPIQPIAKQRRIDRSRVMEMCNVRVQRCQGGLWEIARLEWTSPIKLGPCIFICDRLHFSPAHNQNACSTSQESDKNLSVHQRGGMKQRKTFFTGKM